MSLQEDDEAKAKLQSLAAQSAQQKTELFIKESQGIVMRSQVLMKQRASSSQGGGIYHIVTRSSEHACTLFETVCWPMLATLSVLVELHDEPESVEQCMAGFKHCIRIATHLDMGTERDAVVSSLAKFTYLTTIKEIKQKNIECLKALLDVGLSEGNGLGPSFFHVLQCVSQFERLELMSKRAKPDFQFFADGHEGDGVGHGQGHGHGRSPGGGAGPETPAPGSTVTSGNQILKRRAYGTGATGLMTIDQEHRQIEVVNSEVVMSQIDSTQIDLLFNRSVRLDASAIIHFVRQLARVSQEELALADQPRKFSLQKMVEVAASNMSRPPAVWSQIWKVLRQHFVEVAGHPSKRVGVYAIDSLRQLAFKFLENVEMSKTTLQADFLSAFEAVMIATPSASREVKELVVSSISHVVQNHIKHIKSGWKTVFNILYAAVQERGNEVAPEAAFEVLEKVVDHHYLIFVENFSDGIRALLAFGQCQANVEISLQAVTYLRQAAEYLADRNKPKPPPPPTRDEALASNSAAEVPGPPVTQWFLILRGLQMLVVDKRAGVRQAALTGLFHCLRDHGVAVFDEDMWRMVHKGVVKPLFEDVLHQLQLGDDALTPIVSGVVLRGLRDLQDEHIIRCMPELFPLLCKLVCVSAPDIRQMVQDILLEQVQPHLTRMAKHEIASLPPATAPRAQLSPPALPQPPQSPNTPADAAAASPASRGASPQVAVAASPSSRGSPKSTGQGQVPLGTHLL
jgi:brefeldin A-inhibited guanine nucleotide-exchange protein